MTPHKFGPLQITALILLLLAPLYSIGATLPVHPPLSILIIADEVTPHNLSNADLTQPEDLAPALSGVTRTNKRGYLTSKKLKMSG